MRHKFRRLTWLSPLSYKCDLKPLHWMDRYVMLLKQEVEVNLHRTYGWARQATPAECGSTQASHNHQNPKRTLPGPQTQPHWTKRCGGRVGAASECPSGHCSDYPLVLGGLRQAGYHSSPAPGSPFPQCLSSPRSVPPPLLLSLSGHAAHPGLPPVRRRCSPWVLVPKSLGPPACLFVLVVLYDVCLK